MTASERIREARGARNTMQREVWGLCSGTIHVQGGTGLYATRCDKPAVFVTIRPDNDGNHTRYCASCAKGV